MEEKRKHQRARAYSKIKLSNSREALQVDGFIENVSEGGLGIASPNLIAVGTILTCTFSLDGKDEKITTLGTPVHIKKDANSFFYYGVRFEHIAEPYQCLIREYIKKHPV